MHVYKHHHAQKCQQHRHQNGCQGFSQWDGWEYILIRHIVIPQFSTLSMHGDVSRCIPWKKKGENRILHRVLSNRLKTNLHPTSPLKQKGFILILYCWPVVSASTASPDELSLECCLRDVATVDDRLRSFEHHFQSGWALKWASFTCQIKQS